MIRTVLHKVLENHSHQHMHRDPFFAFSEEVTSLLAGNKAALASISALMEHDLVHLPYPQMTVQFKRSDAEIVWVLWLQEVDGKFNCELRYHVPSRDYSNIACRAKVRSTWDDPDMLVNKLAIPNTLGRGVFAAEVNLNAERVEGATAEERQQIAEDLGPVICTGLAMAVLMTHIGGLESEEHEPPEKLNAARERKGKSPIRRYTYVHVGHVYSRDGTKHDYNKTGRRMPIHMRAGHNRNQFYGKDRALRKLIWIPPVLVNYDEATEPVVEKRVVL